MLDFFHWRPIQGEEHALLQLPQRCFILVRAFLCIWIRSNPAGPMETSYLWRASYYPAAKFWMRMMTLGWRWDGRVWPEENGYSQWEQHTEEEGQGWVIRKNEGMKMVVNQQCGTSVKVGGGAHWLEKSEEIVSLPMRDRQFYLIRDTGKVGDHWFFTSEVKGKNDSCPWSWLQQSFWCDATQLFTKMRTSRKLAQWKRDFLVRSQGLGEENRHW